MLMISLTALTFAAMAPVAPGAAMAPGPETGPETGATPEAPAAEMPLIEALPVDGFDLAVQTPVAAQPPAAAEIPPAPEGAVTTQAPALAPGVEPDGIVLRDPWEKPNRRIFGFDLFFERNLLGPAAHGYAAVVPGTLRVHISNVIYNLDEPSTTLNALVQLKIGRAVKSGVRFVINSTLGIGGLFDVAASGGLPRRVADFGQTLGRYGFKPGPYVMLPVLGPSNLRDGFGRLVDTFTDPVGFVIGGVFTSVGGAARYVSEGVNWRQQNDATIKAIYGATDPYAFTRAAYSQQRAAVVQDATGKAEALPDF